MDHALPCLWPETVTDGDSGLQIAGCSVKQLAASFGTPCWVIAEPQLGLNWDSISAAVRRCGWQHAHIAYSLKANATLSIIRHFALLGADLDVASPYEFFLARSLDIPGARLIVNGVGKTIEHLRDVAEAEVRFVSIDSLSEIERLEVAAATSGRAMRCVLRVYLQPPLLDVDAVAAKLRMHSKFGLDPAGGEVEQAVACIRRSTFLQLVGIHVHWGFGGYRDRAYSKQRDLEATRLRARQGASLLRRLESSIKLDETLPLPVLNLGGGLRRERQIVHAVRGEPGTRRIVNLPGVDEYMDAITTGATDGGVDPYKFELQLELGGFLVSDAVTLITQVIETKSSRELAFGELVVVDASMKMFNSTGFVGWPIEPATHREGIIQPRTLVGQACAYDSIAEGVALSPVKAGDVLAILNQGAYMETEGTHFNATPLPGVVAASHGTARIVKRRETIQDVLSRDIPCS